MSESVTLQDIYALFQRSQAEADRRFAEADRRAAESRAEADRRAAESKAEADRRAAEWEKQLTEDRAEWEKQLAEFRAETDRLRAETDRRAAEQEKQLAEDRVEWEKQLAEDRVEWEKQLAEYQAETERRVAEWNRQLAEASATAERHATEAKIEAEHYAMESKAEADRRAAEWDRRAAESAERLAQLEVLVAQATQAVNGLTSRWGQFVENFVAPGVVQIFQDWGIQVYKTAQRVKASQGGQHIEIDVLATNGHEIVMVEVKSRLTQRHVRQCLKNLERFKTFFPEYKDHCLYGAIAAIEIDEQVDSFAHKQGLFVIQQAGNNIAISNPPTFKPRTW
ncbi:MAG: DUF3782 domain-containing protein [Prochlorothrix sp.]